MRRTVRPRRRRAPPVRRPLSCRDTADATVGRAEKTRSIQRSRIRTAPAHPSQCGLPTRSRRPLAKNFAPLPRLGGDHRKAVQRYVESEEPLQDAREEIDPCALELILVEFELDA